MILHCPECDAVVRAANINVQELAAVCQECDAVFNFDMADVGGRQKRRKYKAPAQLVETDNDDGLAMRYRRVFNEDERHLLIRSIIFAAVMTGVMILTLLVAAPVWVVGFLALLALAGWYALAALWFNTTSLTLDENGLHISKGPLPWFTGAPNRSFARAAIVDVTITETLASRQGSGIKRYHHVRVQQPDGDAITILPSLPQAFARYIAQELNAALSDTEVLLEHAIDDAQLAAMADQLADNLDDILADVGTLDGEALPGFLGESHADQVDRD